jgi:hypothetical protein
MALKIVYPVCCGIDVHKSFVVACIASTDAPVKRRPLALLAPELSSSRFRFSALLRFASLISTLKLNPGHDFMVVDSRGVVVSLFNSIICYFQAASVRGSFPVPSSTAIYLWFQTYSS